MKLALINMDKTSGDPPLGLAFIAGYVREYSKFKDNIVIIDKENIEKRVEAEKPDIVGITSMSYLFSEANNLAGIVKERFGVSTIIGGAHISSFPQHLKNSNFDIGVVGEGEQTVLELMNIFDAHKHFPADELRKVKGLVFRNERGENEATPARELITPLEKIPPPALDLLPMKRWYLLPKRGISGDKMGIYTSLFTSRGCPYTCRFCYSSASWMKLRMLPAKRVVEEIRNLKKKYNIDGIIIWDDLFIASKERLEEIVKLLKEEGLDSKVHFSVTARANLITDELCELMKEMNVKLVGFGLESGSEKILNYLKGDNVTEEKNRRALQICKKYGLRTDGYLIIGSPGETEEDLEMTMDLVRSPDLDNAKIFQLTPLPGTKVWEEAEKLGIVSSDISFDFGKLALGFKSDMIMTKEIRPERFKEWYDRFQEETVKKGHKEFLHFELKHIKYLFSPVFVYKMVKRSGELRSYLKIDSRPRPINKSHP